MHTLIQVWDPVRMKNKTRTCTKLSYNVVAQPGADFGLKPISRGPEDGILKSPGRFRRSELPGGLPCGHHVHLPTGQAGVWVLNKALSRWPSLDETGPGSHTHMATLLGIRSGDK